MDIAVLRQQIDAIDKEMVELFCKRMKIASGIGDYKKEKGLPVHVPEREAEVLEKVSQMADSEFSEDVKAFYQAIFEISRAHQQKRNAEVTK